MRGVGSASGAITFVNALPTGVGAAAAVALNARAEVDLEPRATTEPGADLDVIVGERSPLVVESFRTALEQFGDGKPWSGRIRVSSEVPAARGLKSSSAVSVAILRAVAAALDHATDEEEAARLSADLCQRIGLSATGAFDDALACAGGGLAVTDNRARRVLRRANFSPSLAVLIWVPGGTHAPSSSWKEAFARRAEEGKAAADAVLDGRSYDAMERNTTLVESVMGYSYAAVRRQLGEAGALSAGVSGMGPALAAILPSERVLEVSSVLSRGGGRVLTTRFRAIGESPGEVG